MRLIVGLGNPGARYRDTPHNAGFLVCDRFAERHHISGESKKFRGLFRRGRVGHQDVGVLKPETYMNLSGKAVAEAVRYLPIGGAPRCPPPPNRFPVLQPVFLSVMRQIFDLPSCVPGTGKLWF